MNIRENYIHVQKIRNSKLECDNMPLLITLYDSYLLLECPGSETILFYKDIISLKKIISEIEVHSTYGGWYLYKEMVLKTCCDTFEIKPNRWPDSEESSEELCGLIDGIYVEILDRMVENK